MAPGLVPLADNAVARSALLWARYKVVMGHLGHWAIGRYCSSCSPAAGWTALEWFQQGDNLPLRPPKGWSSFLGAPGTLYGYLSQDASEGFDARFVSLDSGLTSLTSGLIYRPSPLKPSAR